MRSEHFGLFLLASMSLAAVVARTEPAPGLVRQSDLVHQGAFRVPGGTFGGSSFEYGGTALAFNPLNRSLYIVGHDWHQQVAEISIPDIVESAAVDGLSTARVLQPFSDLTEGKMAAVDDPVNGIKVGGLLVYQGHLYQTAFSYYDADVTQVLSHFVSGLDLSVRGDVRGPYQVGTVGASFVSGYLAMVPAAWQPELGAPVLNGQCCLAIVSRTSYGPAIFGVNPADLGTKSRVPAIPFVYYPADRPLAPWDSTGPYFNGSTEVRGVVFPEHTRSVLFFGRHGTGRFCYGTGDECKDPVQPYKGTHAYPYVYYVWAYDVNDFIAVRKKRKDPWDVKPYATWTLSLPYVTGGSAELGGATYDPETGRIFVSQKFGDRTLPVIHVFTLQIATAQVIPRTARPAGP